MTNQKNINIWIEGLQGSGKSTLLQELVTLYPQLKVCREGDYSPVELAWCTWMDKEQYEAVLARYEAISEEIKQYTEQECDRYIVMYTRILTDIPGFHRDLEQYEIYNGRKSFDEIKEIVTSRYKAFQDTGYVFECSFLQNLTEDLILFHEKSDEEILAFYRELYDALDKDSFRLVYLYSDDVEENIRIISKERSDTDGTPLWLPMMLEYLKNSPYGMKHSLENFDDLIAHLKHRQYLELRIIKEVVREHAVILPSKKCSKELLLFDTDRV
ncbi:MAG: hypothetical protein E7268_04040 [Lachnospiraceae bacterium]|nr:hypothetical protein [Lachnospiraceae bacterium]